MTFSVTQEKNRSSAPENRQFKSRCTVPIGGFELIQRDRFVLAAADVSEQLPSQHNEKKLTEIDPEECLVQAGFDERDVDPLGNMILHRQFADLRSTREFLEFSRKWGLLGGQATHENSRLKLEREKYGAAESINAWRREVADMNALISIYEAAKHDDLDKMNSFVGLNSSAISLSYSTAWAGDGLTISPLRQPEGFNTRAMAMELSMASERFNIRQFSVARSSHNELIFGVFRESGMKGVILRFVHSEIQRRLDGLVTVEHPTFVSNKFRFSIWTLRAAIWLQLWMELTGVGSHTRCNFCAQWIADATVRKMYCGTRCKQAAHRRNRRHKHH